MGVFAGLDHPLQPDRDQLYPAVAAGIWNGPPAPRTHRIFHSDRLEFQLHSGAVRAAMAWNAGRDHCWRLDRCPRLGSFVSEISSNSCAFANSVPSLGQLRRESERRSLVAELVKDDQGAPGRLEGSGDGRSRRA